MSSDLQLNQSLEAEGWTIRYGVFGPSGPTGGKAILFVHGTPWSSEVFKPLARALLSQRKHRVILYDLGGYGLSQERSLPSDDEERYKEGEWVGGKLDFLSPAFDLVLV